MVGIEKLAHQSQERKFSKSTTPDIYKTHISLWWPEKIHGDDLGGGYFLKA